MNSMQSGSFRFSRKKSNTGFTLVEVLVAQTIVILSGLALMPYLIEEGEQKLLDTAANEMYVIADAAKAYRVRYGAWPNQANNCAAAAAITAMETDGFIGGVTPSSIYGTNYTFSCNPTNRFVINLGVGAGAERTKYAQDLANLAYASTVDATTNTVAMNVPLPGAELALDQVLWRTYDASRPERNRMQTAVDMNNNDLTNAREVFWGEDGNRSVLASDSSVQSIRGIFACQGDEAGCGIAVSNDGGFYDLNNGYVTLTSNGGNNPLTGTVAGGVTSLRIGAGSGLLPNDALAQGGLDIGGTLHTRDSAGIGGFDLTLGSFDQVTRGNSGNSRALVKGLNLATNTSALVLNYAGDYPAGVQVDGPAMYMTSGQFLWANQSSLHTAEGGSMELGGNNTSAGTGAPYIDFHYAGLAQDYNVRIQNNANGQLLLDAPTTLTTGDLVVNGAGEIKQTLDVATDVVLQSTQKGLSQAIADAYILDPAAAPAARTVAKPTCPPGRTPVVFTAVSGVANGASAYPIHQIDTYAIDNGYSWTAEMSVTTTQTAAAPPDAGFGKIFMVTKCD